MCQLFRTTLDDPIIQEMDPVQKIWMFENWLHDFKEKQEESKYLGYLIGSFTNPKAVQDLINRDKNAFISDDEEFEELSRKIVEHNRKQDKPIKGKRKRKILNK